jgi:fumarate hydratase subunit beta
MTHLTLPADGEAVARLRVGETVLLSGIILTARDAAHKYLVETFVKGTPPPSELALYDKLKADLNGGAIYHCGPVVAKSGGGYIFVSAGPTTSIREEVYEDLVMAHFNVKVIIGKGGMGPRTLKACREQPAVYLHAIGGAGTLIAASVQAVLDVYKLAEFGAPEAFWKIRVKDIPTVVTMDSAGDSLHTTVAERSRARLVQLLASA